VTIHGRKKRTLTLLELFICLGILATASSLLILRAKPMVARYQFTGSATRLINELEWSYKVAMSACADIDFTIEQKGNKLFCKRTTDEPLGFKGGNRTFVIDHIPSFLFDDKEEKVLRLSFTRSGFILPEGRLKICSSKKGTFFVVHLPPKEKSRITADLEK